MLNSAATRATWPVALLAALSGLPTTAIAALPDDAKGLWITPEKDAVIEFSTCPERPDALCGTIVWDKDAGTPNDTCGTRIAQVTRFDKDAWKDGWIHDPRSNKNYKLAMRTKERVLTIRAFIGVEALGESSQFARVDALPSGPACRKK